MARTTPARRYDTPDGAASYVKVSRRTILRWVAEGKITGYRLGDRALRIDLNELDQLARPVAGQASR